MEAHVKTLGLLYILGGSFGGLAALLFLALFPGPAWVAAYGPVVAYMITGWMWLMLVLGVPVIVVGAGLMKFRPWARSAGTVLAVLEMLNFPIGTALGLYALWVLISPDTDPLFSPRFQ